jgi:hypothetical protein
VRRNGRERNLDLAREAIPEPLFAQMVGTHMIEGHLAYMNEHDPKEQVR